MMIEKNGKLYEVTEQKRYWLVTLKSESPIEVAYRVSKDLCSTLEEVKTYIRNENMF